MNKPCGHHLRVAMTAGERGGSVTQVFSFNVPGVSKLLWTNRAATGSLMVTVIGTGMGLVSITGKMREGHSACEATELSLIHI